MPPTLTGFVRRLEVQELRDHDAHIGEEAHERKGMRGHDQRQDGGRTSREGLIWYPERSNHMVCSLK